MRNAHAVEMDASVRAVCAAVDGHLFWSQAMNEASQKNPGGMGSIVGLADDALKAVVEAARAEAGGVLEVANYLFPKGRVVSGT